MDTTNVETKLPAPAVIKSCRQFYTGSAIALGGFALIFTGMPLKIIALAIFGGVVLIAGFITMFTSPSESARRADPAQVVGNSQWGVNRRWDLDGVNPSTGLPMMGGVDTGGNAFGAGRRNTY